MPEQEWTDWPENDCTREHPDAGCKVKTNSFKHRPSKAGTGSKPFPDLPDLWHDHDPGGANRAYKVFEVDVDFASDEQHACCCCEYRQRVKGVTLHNGVSRPTKLPGGDLSETTWMEDGIVDHFGPGKHLLYGHRDQPSDPLDEYYSGDDFHPNRKNGCRYRGRDAVNVPLEPGWKVDVEFEGLIIDVCKKVVVTRKYWRVKFETK
jgi:hypothetical protein